MDDIGFLAAALKESIRPELQPDESYLQKDGFGMYLFEIVYQGVAHPVVIQKIREDFGDFEIVSSICERIKKIIKERLPERFSSMEKALQDDDWPPYLKRYYPGC